MKLSDKITTLRKQNGMSQEDLAERLSVSRQAISRWEMGSAMPDANNILQISKLFGVTADYLLNDDYTSDNDIPKIQEIKKDNTYQVLICLVTVEAMCLILQFISAFVLQRVVFLLLSFIPFIACIGGFEYAYHKRLDEQNDTTRKFRRTFYKISAWLGLYFPIKILAHFCMILYPRPVNLLVFECVTVVIYIISAIVVNMGIDKKFNSVN